MFPTYLLIGFLVGFLPRPWYLAGIAIVGAAWPLFRVVAGDTVVDGPSMVGEFALATANAAAGAVIARLLVNAVRAVRG
ncbi:MAG: hypothetical protein ACRDJC_03410 [Thermomicrobiales bacterium]